MRIAGIDAGTEQSALVVYDTNIQNPVFVDFADNSRIAGILRCGRIAEVVALEWVSFYGKEIHAGSETFQTCRWVGRFQEAWCDKRGEDSAFLITRREVRQELCGTTKAGDAEVRAILIDRFGGKEQAIGTKKQPGPLYTLRSTHLRSALAVALVHADRISGLPRP